MKTSSLFALLMLFTIGWVAFSLFDFYMTTQNSDCSYLPIESCTHLARAEQKIVVWRGLAVQLAAVLAALLLRKH